MTMSNDAKIVHSRDAQRNSEESLQTLVFIPRNLDSAATDKPDITEIKTSIRVSKFVVP